jgi:hypothetical protein
MPSFLFTVAIRFLRFAISTNRRAHALGLLRPRRKWDCSCAAHEADEVVPPHCPLKV